MDKQKKLIDTALRLFYRHGVHAIGINEVLAQSGIAKQTLYNHFESKDALIQACVTERHLRFSSWFQKVGVEAETVPDFINQIFLGLDDWINSRVSELGEFNGCFFVNVTAEYSDFNDKIYLSCREHKTAVKAYFEQQFLRLKCDEYTASTLAELLLMLKEGCINNAHVMGDKNAALKAKAFAQSYIQT